MNTSTRFAADDSCGNCSASDCPTTSMKYGACASSARWTTSIGSLLVRDAGVGRDELFFRHRVKHGVAAIAAAPGRRERRPVIRRLNHAGDRRRLAQREVRDVLAEEQPRGLGDAVHGERAALAQVHVVQVELEDLVLRRLALEDERHVLLGQLSLQRLLGRQEEVLDQLLRDRAAADQVRPIAAHVGDDGAHRPDDVDAGVVVEAAVLDGEHRLNHARGNRGERHAPALLAAGVDEPGEQRRVQCHPRRRLVVDLESANAKRRCRRLRRLWHIEVHADEPALRRAVARQEDDRVAADGELARLLDARSLRVAEVIQPVDELVCAHRLAAIQLERPGVDARQHAVALAVQAVVDLPAEDDPPVGEDADDERADDAADGEEAEPAVGAAPG